MNPERKSDQLTYRSSHFATPRYWRRPHGGWIVALALILLAGAGWAWRVSAQNVTGVALKSLYIGTVQRGTFAVRIRATGKLIPAQSRWIAAPATGVLEQVWVEPGQRVHRGEPLVTLSNPQMANAAQSAAAALAAARADLIAQEQSEQSAVLNERSRIASMKVDLESSAMHVAADRKLAAEGIVGHFQYADEKLRYGLQQKQLHLEQQRLARLKSGNRALLRAERERIEQQSVLTALRESELSQLTVRAPVAGQIEEINAQIGQQVSVGTDLARISSADSLMAQLHVSQYSAASVRPGLAVRIDAHNGVVAGRVVRVDPTVKDGVVTVDVRLTGTAPAGSRADESVTATIRVATLRHVEFVYRPAGAQSGKKTHVFVLTPKGNRAVRRTVHFGVGSIDRIQVLSGLHAGQRLILSDTSAYADDHALALH
jgi:multidrug efflux pump subunit AcrA (membrane-fusion protein)